MRLRSIDASSVSKEPLLTPIVHILRSIFSYSCTTLAAPELSINSIVEHSVEIIARELSRNSNLQKKLGGMSGAKG